MTETAASALTVLRTRLPYVDRRALSEAWIDALGLQRDDGGTSGVRVAHRRPASDASAAPVSRDRTPAAGAPSTGASQRYAAIVRRPAAADDVRAPLDVRNVRRARRAPAGAERSYPPRRTSLTVGVDGTRVQLILRREASVLHVIALCRADVAPAVREALARADAFLRVRGDALRASVRTVHA